jgi:hypothetical protein
MKIQSKILVVILPVVACFAFLPGAQAVCQDGCDSSTFSTFQGDNALLSGSGTGNTAFGWSALFLTSATSFNTGIGGGALALNNSDDNTAVGAGAMLLNLSGNDNVAVGTDALLNNSTGAFNNAVGSFALFDNIGGTENEAFGDDALLSNLGSHNTAMGDDALLNNTVGDGNTAIGREAGDSIVDGNDNIAIGHFGGSGIVDASDVIAIGLPGVSSAFGDASNTCYIGQIFGEPVGVGPGQAVFVDSDGVLGFTTSSRRVKHDIKPMDKASETLYALKPVTFKYNKDKSNMTCFGLIAEDVAEVNPELVLRSKDGDVSTVRYEQINAMLLNEFLKEHKKVEQQQASISELKGEMQTMVAQLKEQAAQIQKVSAQVQVNKPAPQVVVNKP